MFELQTQTVQDLRTNKRFYVDTLTGHIFWLEQYDLLSAPIGEDDYALLDEVVSISIGENFYPDVAARNRQIEAILWRRRGEEELARRAEQEARNYQESAKHAPEKCAWLLPAEDAEEYINPR